jgi:ribonuclease HI
MDLVVNTDGASKGNPGPSSYGFIIKARGGAILHEEGEQIGHTTNNVAEYTAVIKALEYIASKFSRKAPHKIEIVSDSRLLVEQLSGRFKIKSPNLLPLFDKIKILEMENGTVFYRSVPREENFVADRLANRAFEKKI